MLFDVMKRGTQLGVWDNDRGNVVAGDGPEFTDCLVIIRVCHGNEQALCCQGQRQCLIFFHLVEGKNIQHRPVDVYMEEVDRGCAEMHVQKVQESIGIQIAELQENRSNPLSALALPL